MRRDPVSYTHLFYSIGEALQERAVERARRNIRALVDIRPEQANVLVEGKPVAMPAAQVVPGRTIEVLPGGRVPLDGVLLSEAAPFNTAALTGESTPRTIRKGEEVLAGMISSLQPVRIEVTRPLSLIHICTNTLRLVGNGLFRGNSSASGEWFIDRQRRQSNRCPAGRNLVVARIDAMDRNHSAYSAPAPTDKPDLENPEFK